MASRRTQVRQIFQSLSPAEFSGTTLEALHARCEANLAAVDAWSTQGNQRAVRQAGTGLVAICAWMAAKALAEQPQARTFQNASGLTPAQFNAAQIELTPAIQRIASSSSATSTPRKKRETDPAAAEAMAQWIKDMTSGGMTPSKRSAGPFTPSSGRRAAALSSNPGSEPGTPSRSGLRDRGSIKAKTLFDPSPISTPTRPRAPVKSQTPSSVAASVASPVKHSTFSVHATPQSAKSSALTPSKLTYPAAKATRKRYAASLGFQLDGSGPEEQVRWDESQARKQIKRCLDTLKTGQRHDGWSQELGGVERVLLQ